MEVETIPVGVVMQRKALNSRWQPWQWSVLDVVEALSLQDGPAVRCLLNDVHESRWLFAGLSAGLFRDEAEGYFLNVDSPRPCWFIMWRLQETPAPDTPALFAQAGGEQTAEPFELAVPLSVTLSYNEASRWMDGGEQVENVPASPEINERLQQFVAQHYKPEVKRKRRKPSFEGGEGVDQMARAERGSGGDVS